MMSEKILACPYCGSDQVEPRETWGKRYVYCNDCNATGPTTTGGKNDAILLWNAAYNALEAKDAEIKQLRDGIAELSRDFLRETKRVAAAANVLEAKGIEYELLRDEHELLKNEYKQFADNARAEIAEHRRHVATVMKRESDETKAKQYYYDELQKEKTRAAIAKQERDELQDERNVLQKELDRWRDMVIPITAERDEARRVAKLFHGGIKAIARYANDWIVILDTDTRTEPPTTPCE